MFPGGAAPLGRQRIYVTLGGKHLDIMDKCESHRCGGQNPLIWSRLMILLHVKKAQVRTGHT